MRDRGRRFVLLGVVVLLAVTGLTLGPVRAAVADDPVKVMLLLDVSGSMNEKLSSGGTKLAAAKSALKRVADSLPAGTQVGLRVYGSKIKEPKEENPKACQDTDLVMPIGPLERNRMYAAVDSFQAVGETPIAYSLEQTVADLGDQGRRVVVLISDGEENCVPDPCPVAKKLAAKGVDLQFNAIGFDVNSKARKQLQCIVDETDGSYYDADDTDELNDSLDKLTRRALRPFALSGKPIMGGVGNTSTPPRIKAGHYRSTYDLKGLNRYYWIERTIPGSTITVSATVIVPRGRQGANESWSIALRGPDQPYPCSSGVFADTGADGTAAVMSQALTSTGGDFSCAEGDVLLELARLNNNVPGTELQPEVGVEIVVTEEPPIANLAELPPGLTDESVNRKPVDAAKQAESVVGGVAFSDAPVLQPGSYLSSIVVGETLVYQVPVQPGQRLRATLDTPVAGRKWGFEGPGIGADLSVFSAKRALLDQQSGQVAPGSPAKTVRTTAATPEIRIRNRELKGQPNDARPVVGAAFGGNHYVMISLRPQDSDLLGVLTPVRLNIAVDGSPTGLPVYAEQSSPGPSTPGPSSPDPSSPASTPSSETPVPTSPGTGSSETPAPGSGAPGAGGALAGVLGILAVLVVAGAVTVFLLRRRAAARGRGASGPGGSSGPPETP
ncbi:VWA domain-containing protein [Microlunatus sp. GCM10028923]|uniref:vWA domain-containing protein n=1 Tax=Microlunatus sp. GCM10028923 TaxID=3273400 RepID=UPI00361107E6